MEFSRHWANSWINYVKRNAADIIENSLVFPLYKLKIATKWLSQCKLLSKNDAGTKKIMSHTNKKHSKNKYYIIYNIKNIFP